MSASIWLTYVAAVLILMLTPGPSQLLMLSNSLSNGFGRSIATAAGDLTANALQMLAAGLGLAALLAATQYGLTVVKWAGVAYLVWLGALRIFKSFSEPSIATRAPKASLRVLWMQGFLTSAANPKAVVFFAALFPQFISKGGTLWVDLLVLGGTYIAIDAAFLCAYGAGAGWLAERMRGPARAWLDRLAGGGLIGAAFLLALKTVREN